MNNDKLRQILPLLRPRSAEMNWFILSVLILLCLGIATLIALYILRRRRHRRQAELHFRHLGMEKGLSAAQTGLLLRIALHYSLRNPLRLFTSAHTFERYVGGFATRRAQKERGDPLLEQVAAVRAALGFAHSAPDQPLHTSRQLQRGQTLMVWQENDEEAEGTPWLVIHCDEGSLDISPLLKEDQSPDLAPGTVLSLRFWREGDTEYRFDSEVGAVEGNRVVLWHSNKLQRTQLRDFFRVGVHFAITLLGLSAGEEAEVPSAGEAEDSVLEPALPPHFDPGRAPRLKGQVVDLSAGGFGLLTRDPVPAVPRFIVDPAFEGPFPLASLRCELVREQEYPGGTRLMCRFVQLPPAIERQIVRKIYQRQLGEDFAERAPAAE